jgi:hypothetical protein
MRWGTRLGSVMMGRRRRGILYRAGKLGADHGRGLFKPIVQWSRGEYTNANNTQNDLNVIQQNGLSYRGDDYGEHPGHGDCLSGLSITNTGLLERTNRSGFLFVRAAAGRLGVQGHAVGAWGERASPARFYDFERYAA